MPRSLQKIVMIVLMLLNFSMRFLLAQDRCDLIGNQLQVLSMEIPGLEQVVDVSVSKMPVQEFFRSLAATNKLNIAVDPDLNIPVTNSFTDVPVRDVLIFMCREYGLDIQVTGRIISIEKYSPPKEITEIKSLLISYDTSSQLLSMDLKNDSLSKVTRELTRLTGRNIIYTPELHGKLIYVFVEKDSLNDALEKIAISNNLSVVQKDDFFIFYEETKTTGNKAIPNAPVVFKSAPFSTQPGILFPYRISSSDDITLNASGISIGDVINTISQSLHVNYFIYSDLKDPVTVNLSHVTYEELLHNLLNGTNYTYRQKKGIYLIGEREQEGIRAFMIIKLKYRSITDIEKVIPDMLKKEVRILEFPDLNSMILSGSVPVIGEIENFLS